MSGTIHDGQGAGIFNEGQLMLLHSTVADNQVTGDGSGAGRANSGTLTIHNSSLIDNVATDTSDGGALTNVGNATIVNSTLSGNTAAADGGALYNTGTLTINNSTLSANGADGNGGGILNGGSLAMRNTIIANSPLGGDCVDAGTVATHSHNLIEDGSCSAAQTGDPNLSTLGNYTLPSTSSGNALPELVEGSAPPTFSLLPGSLALETGDDATCETTDQRRESRVGVCDIGATES